MDEHTQPSLASLIDINATAKKGRVTFKTAMQQMGLTSLFDIIRLPKAVFARQLEALSDADGRLAYDNALSYAVQIGRLYREYQTSSGLMGTYNRTGVRSLVSLGATYQNLFKENWDDFCSVGAIAAIDSPVAYASRLYNFIGEIEQLTNPESAATDTRALLEKRRPDLKNLVIDEQSTFTPRPMLDIVIEVLTKSVRAYLDTLPADKTKPLYEVMAERRYPFEFPYNFYHQQCLLGLAPPKPGLGELNYRISRLLPLFQSPDNRYGKVSENSAQAQRLLSGLSPQQQQLLIEPALFTTFYLNTNEISEIRWKSISTTTVRADKAFRAAYVIPTQPSVAEVTPSAVNLGSGTVGSNNVILKFNNIDAADIAVKLNFISTTLTSDSYWTLNSLHAATGANLSAAGGYYTAHNSNQPLPTTEGYSTRFYLLVATNLDADNVIPLGLSKLSYTLTLDEHYTFTPEQQTFFQQHYGRSVTSPEKMALAEVTTFMQYTGLNALQVETLLSQRSQFPRLSANVPSTNPHREGITIDSKKVLPFPHSSHYGACYVNGNGSGNYDSLDVPTVASIQKDQFDNSMTLEPYKSGELDVWHITKTSPDRFDRLQRMVRLQRWTNIPFAELDTLITAAIRAEGEANLGMELNLNTLRTLGVYQYLNRQYTLGAEEFAAFLYYLSPYATGKRLPLFDQVFNQVQLFDTPLILDQTAFTVDNPNPAAQRTLLQLCAGLGLQPSEDSLLLLARQTLKHLGALSRDLTTVSSIYRQARIARMFGLSVSDTLDLAGLLGGETYQQHLCTGKLTAHGDTTDDAPDLLDVLMQMDWAVAWLKDSELTVGQLQRLLGVTVDKSPMPPLVLERLLRLMKESAASVVTAQQLSALGLPAKDDDQAVIDWFKVLLDEKGAAPKQPLIDAAGLVLPLSLDETSDATSAFESRLTVVVGRLKLQESGLKQHVVETLQGLMLSAQDRQALLISGLLHDTVKLQKERVAAVLAWAGTSVYAFLSEALKVADSPSPALITLYQKVARYAEAVQTLRINNTALTLFLLNPAWLSADDYVPPSPVLAGFYLLERFSHWHRSQSQPEENLLGYFNLANPAAAQLKNKALRLIASDSANAALAQVLDWDEQQVASLTATLPDNRATTLAQVDWVRRCQAACLASGLSANSLLQVTELNTTSTFANWKTAGESVVAASRSSESAPV
ncbi:Tc toxin subunit A [Pseudomonas sp. B21-053]|uniref:Tc toxin subunit A n=1 Tax=Pseudomonas sp. B21-053 TaxID=2895493 RepID=UPI00222F7056|nr:Tc toxin subunit A [Pseudomonas sp. B21-053]UZE10741.1 Tc toxin subunit A [Pseudomonas sp. B21-053]